MDIVSSIKMYLSIEILVIFLFEWNFVALVTGWLKLDLYISTGFCFIYFEALKTIKYKGEISVDCI